VKQNNQDYDSPWKDILEVYFREFLKFFSPKLKKTWIGKRDMSFWIRNFRA